MLLLSAIFGLILTLLDPPATATAPANVDASSTLRILTWNIQGCASGLEPILDELRRHNADIICLQEAEVGTAHTNGADQAALIAQKLRLYQASAGSAFATGGEQHMAILSRQPLEKSEPLDAHTGRIYGLTAITRLHGQPVRIVCLHLTNRYWRGLKAAMKSDNAPVREAADLARRLRTWPEPVIVAGDFNATPGMREHALIAKYVKRVPTTQPTFPADKPTLAVDHICHSPGLRPTRHQVIDSQASDHRPVLIELQIPLPASKPADGR